MGNACTATAEEKGNDTIYTTFHTNDKEENKESGFQSSQTKLVNKVRIMKVRRSVLGARVLPHIVGGAEHDGEEEKESPGLLKIGDVDSLLRLPTAFKVEPWLFRLERRKDSLVQRYEVLEMIGRGAFGEVRKIRERNTSQIRALKVMTKSKCQMTDNFADEIEIVKKLDHPNVVRFYEFFQDEESYYLVTEFCEGGDLLSKVQQEVKFSEEKASRIILQLLSAISFCHEKNIVHRDLKPENIMLEGNSEECFIKVIDFGRSKILPPKQKITERAGSLFYIAPEVLQIKEYNQSCDIWSAGVILYLLLHGQPPFFSNVRDETIKLIIEGKINLDDPSWNDKTSDVKSLLREMLQYDPDRRISAKEALSHQWLLKHNSPFQVEEEELLSTLCNLTAFKTQMTFQKAVLAYLASQQLSTTDEKRLKEVFQLLDTNKNGLISHDELKQGLELVYGDEEKACHEAKRIIHRIDLNQNGSIDYNEFLMANLELKKVLSEDYLKEAFNFFDTNNDGGISLEELKGYFRCCCTDKIIDKLMTEVDIDQDGMISYEEFARMMQQYQKFNAKTSRKSFIEIEEDCNDTA